MKKAYILLVMIILSSCSRTEIEDYNLFEGVVYNFDSKTVWPEPEIVLIRTYYHPASRTFQNTHYDTISTDQDARYALNFNSGYLENNRLYYFESANIDYSAGHVSIINLLEETGVNYANLKNIVFNQTNFDSVYLGKATSVILNFQNLNMDERKSIVSSVELKELRGRNNQIIESEIEVLRRTASSPIEQAVLRLDMMHALNPSIILKYTIVKEGQTDDNGPDIDEDGNNEGRTNNSSANTVQEEIEIFLRANQTTTHTINY